MKEGGKIGKEWMESEALGVNACRAEFMHHALTTFLLFLFLPPDSVFRRPPPHHLDEKAEGRSAPVKYTCH